MYFQTLPKFLVPKLTKSISTWVFGELYHLAIGHTCESPKDKLLHSTNQMAQIVCPFDLHMKCEVPLSYPAASKRQKCCYDETTNLEPNSLHLQNIQTEGLIPEYEPPHFLRYCRHIHLSNTVHLAFLRIHISIYQWGQHLIEQNKVKSHRPSPLSPKIQNELTWGGRKLNEKERKLKVYHFATPIPVT
jgi:hypothetical protein